jgi:hypothetical protein
MRAWWTALLGAGLVVAAIIPRQAEGFCLNIPQGLNKPVAWQTIPVTYRVSDNLTDASMLKAIDDAFATWGSVKCSTLKFTKGAQFKICTETDKSKCPTGTVHFEHGTSYIYIFWYDNSNKASFPTAASNAYYNYLWFGMTAQISGASLAVNAFNFKWNATGGDKTGILDLQNEATTMVGSVIGLTDPKIAGSSMTAQMTYGDTSKRDLAQDDIDGLTYLYFDTADTSCTKPGAPGANGCTGGTPATDGPPLTGDGKPPAGDGNPPVTGDGPPASGDGYVPSGDGYVPSGDGYIPGGDAGSGGGGDDDDGCGCKLGHRGRLPLKALLLLALPVVLLVLRRRRCRRRR